MQPAIASQPVAACRSLIATRRGWRPHAWLMLLCAVAVLLRIGNAQVCDQDKPTVEQLSSFPDTRTTFASEGHGSRWGCECHDGLLLHCQGRLRIISMVVGGAPMQAHNMGGASLSSVCNVLSFVRTGLLANQNMQARVCERGLHQRCVLLPLA
jgi:hypothetical protein